MNCYTTALSIAGSDPSGGAGIQADIKTMSALGVYGMTAITAIAVQNTSGVRSVTGIEPEAVAAQIDAVFDDIYPDAVKIGMLFSPDIANIVADRLVERNAKNIVLDPVMVATSGDRLISEEAIDIITRRIIPVASLITPNVNEAIALTGTDDLKRQIEELRKLGAKNVLLKGGDRDSSNGMSVDYLALEGYDEPVVLESRRVITKNNHGTGCTLSSAIASCLALGYDMVESVSGAKRYITDALKAGAGITIGHGHGPVNHLYAPVPLKITTKQ